MATKTFLWCLFQARKLFSAFGKLKEILIHFFAPCSSPALANEGLFELTQCPSLTQLSSSAETTVDWLLPSCSQVKIALSPDYNQVLGSFRGWQQRVQCQLKKPFNWLGPVRRKERGIRQESIQVTKFLKKFFPTNHFSNHFSSNGNIFIPDMKWICWFQKNKNAAALMLQ